MGGMIAGMMGMHLVERNTERKLSFLVPHVLDSQSVLDFGCGDLSVAKALHEALPSLDITGVDVVDFGVRYRGITFRCYDGFTLPWEDRCFDTVIAWHVLHHCSDPERALKECCRVARKRLIMVEPTFRSALEIPLMRIADWLLNAWKTRTIGRATRYYTRNQWRGSFARYHLILREERDVEIFPRWLPVGRSVLFVADRRGKRRSVHV